MYSAVKIDTVAIVPLRELQAPLVEVTEPSVPNLGAFIAQLCCPIVIRAQVKLTSQNGKTSRGAVAKKRLGISTKRNTRALVHRMSNRSSTIRRNSAI